MSNAFRVEPHPDDSTRLRIDHYSCYGYVRHSSATVYDGSLYDHVQGVTTPVVSGSDYQTVLVAVRQALLARALRDGVDVSLQVGA